MSRYDASFEEGWGAPAEKPFPAAHGDAVERGEVVPAARFRRSPTQPDHDAEPRSGYLPWYERRKKVPRGRPLYAPPSDARDGDPGAS